MSKIKNVVLCVDEEPEIVFCRAVKCVHNTGDNHCDVVGLNGDDKISIDETGRCENYSTN